MKKTSTYLFLLVAAANVGVGFLIGHTARFMLRTYQDILGGMSLPLISRQVLSVPWWPYIFVGVGVIGAIVSIITKIKSSVLSHALCIILISEIAGLAITAFGLCFPLYIPTPRLLP